MGSSGAAFADITFPKISHHRPNTHNHHYQVLSHAVRRLCVGSGSDLRRPRFVAVTTYRCRVRFRRPLLDIIALLYSSIYLVLYYSSLGTSAYLCPSLTIGGT